MRQWFLLNDEGDIEIDEAMAERIQERCNRSIDEIIERFPLLSDVARRSSYCMDNEGEYLHDFGPLLPPKLFTMHIHPEFGASVSITPEGAALDDEARLYGIAHCLCRALLGHSKEDDELEMP